MTFSRREFLGACLGGAAVAAAGWFLGRKQGLHLRPWVEKTFIARAPDYQADIAGIIIRGLKELGLPAGAFRGTRVLLKPNLVETARGHSHINTHPLVVRGAAEAFLRLGAAQVLVAEGPGHCRDTLRIIEESGLSEVLREDRIPFLDLNYADGVSRPNLGGYSRLAQLTLPAVLEEVDWIVSLPKLKTHHWAGVTLAMKNLFGLMPGIYYGWPKNVLHYVGINEAIVDICATVRPQLAIADGIIGMEGDGPIMGTPRPAGVLVLGRNLAAVDATCARVMGIDPLRVKHLARADYFIGPIQERDIVQVGEQLSAVRIDFQLLPVIPAQKGLRL